MPRLPEIDPTTLSAEQKQVYDTIASGPRGRVRGPLAVWLRRAKLADRAQALGQYCRYDSSLSKRLSELAILVTGAVWKAEFEWFAHAPIALEAGISAEAIDAIRTGKTPAFDKEDEAVVYAIATAMNSERRLSDELYARGLAALGEGGMVDLIGVLGYYSLISMTINAFKVDVPKGTSFAFKDGVQS